MKENKKPEEVLNFIKDGFIEEFGSWEPVWGQGDGHYYRTRLNKGFETIICDIDMTDGLYIKFINELQ